MNEIVAEFYVPTREQTESEFSPNEREQVDFDVKFKTTIHNDLSDRERENCHPVNAITGLSDELDRLSVLASGYVHEQGVASAVWTVQHNLNKYPSVNVVDSAGNEIISEVTYNDENSVTITMNGASKGRAYLN